MTNVKQIEAAAMETAAAGLVARAVNIENEKWLVSPNGRAARTLSKVYIYRDEAARAANDADGGYWDYLYRLDDKAATEKEITVAFIAAGILEWRSGAFSKYLDCLSCYCGWPCIHGATRAARAVRLGY